MTDIQIKQTAMCATVSRFTTTYAAALDVVESVAAEATDVRTANDVLLKRLANPIVQTKDVTALAVTARRMLRKSLPSVLGPLASVATKAKDINLLAKATLRARQLNRLTDSELNELANSLISLGEAQPIAVQTRYGLNLVLPLLRTYQTDFAPLVGQTQDLIDSRSSDNLSTEDLLKLALQQVYELDKVMLVYKLLNPALYRDYRKARFVGKRSGGGGSGKKSE